MTWSESYPLYQPTCKGNTSSKLSYREIYPSLIDPASPSNNYDLVGEYPYIYYTVFQPNEVSPTGRDVVVRSIARRPLKMY